jgi:hypothetical protein
MYAIYTPSHKIFLDKYFLPSIKDNFEVVLKFIPQECESAEFLKEGWTDTTLKKVDFIIDAIRENWDKVFIFSDVDIVFFQPIEKIIKQMIHGNDFVIQQAMPLKLGKQNKEIVCTGFFVMRGNQNNLNLWLEARKYVKKLSDQKSFNLVLMEDKFKKIKWKFLPVGFFNGGLITGKHWVPGQELEIPQNIYLHHGNWTNGINNKIAQLDYVIRKVKKLSE